MISEKLRKVLGHDIFGLKTPSVHVESGRLYVAWESPEVGDF